MKVPKWRGVRLPAGAILPNWPLLAGTALSLVILVGLFFTGEAPPETPDPLAQVLVDDTPVDVVPEQQVEQVVDRVENQVRATAAETARRERDEQLRREAAAREEQRRELERQRRFRQANEQLEILRARVATQTTQREQNLAVPNVLATSEQAQQEEIFLLENMTRENEAPRSPMVVTTARGLSGGRTHGLREHPVRSPRGSASGPGPGRLGRTAPVPVPGTEFPSAVPPSAGSDFDSGSFPSGGLVPPPRDEFGTADVVPAPGLPPQSSGQGVPTPSAPSYPSSSGGGFGQVSPVASAALPGDLQAGGSGGRLPSEPAGTVSSGPAVVESPAGVVVTPHDGSAYRLYEGTLLPAVLQNQIQGDFTGPISAQVTRPVWSRDRQRILIPRGTVALGTAQGAEGPFQGRLAVGFYRLIFPDGRWVRMAGDNALWGLSGLGESSLRDQVQHHYLQAFGTAGAIGLLAAFSNQGSAGAVAGGGIGVQSALAQAASQTALQVMNRFLNRRPTVTIRAGHRVQIRLMTDLLIPAASATRPASAAG